MITKTVKRTNDQIRKVRRKINTDEFLFCYRDTNKEEINVYMNFFILEVCTTKKLWYDTFSTRKIYRAGISLNRNDNIS